MYEAVMEVASPITFAILIIVLVLVPLFMLESLEKKMFEPLAMTMCFALISSLIVSLTIIPAISYALIGRNIGTNKAEKWILDIYTPMLSFILKRRRWTGVIILFLIISMFFIIPMLGTEFLPPLDEGAIAINVVRLPSAALISSKLQSLNIEKELRKRFPEIITIVSKSGRAEISEDPMGPEQTDMVIMLKNPKSWKSGKTKQQLVNEIREILKTFPGIKPAFSQPIALRVNELISGVKSDVAIKIFGDNIEKLKEIAEKVSPLLSKVRGAIDIKIEPIAGFSQIEVALKRQEMARHKINASIINTIVETAIGGKVISSFIEGEKRFDIILRFPLKHRNSIEKIKNILVKSPLGYHIPLERVARIEKEDTPAQISRENGQRRLIVECNIWKRDMGGFIHEAKKTLKSLENTLPIGYRFVWGGQFENQQRAMKKLMVVVPIAILIIFIMLFTVFRSMKSAIMVLFNLPFAIFGGVIALFLLQINVSVSAIIGLIALLGIAVQDGTVMVSFFHQLEAKGFSVYEAVLKGSKLRARSIITTSLTTLLGILPMLYTSGPGAEIQRPVATVVVGGLLSALILVLLLFPALYLVVNEKKKE